MSNLLSLKNNIANSLKDSNKKKSHSKFVSTSGILENSDFKKFLELYLSNETEFFERIDGYDGFISTQQIESINYENFSEHVFFDSAVEKVNYAFDKAINDFPYDQTNFQISQYLKKLDGFTRFVLKEKVEKSTNYLRFTGNEVVVIEDKKGYLLNDYSGDRFVNNFNPNTKNISFDFWICPLNESNENKKTIVFKKYDNTNKTGFFCTANYLNNTCKLVFYFSEGSNFFNVSYDLSLNKFQHVFFEIFNESNTVNQTKNFRIFIDGKEINKEFLKTNTLGNLSSLFLNFNTQDFINENFYIGSSDIANIQYQSDVISLDKPFEGLIDEFKLHIGKGDKRKYENILKFKDENEHASEDLVICLRMNEKEGNYPNNFVLLDYSGNKLHGQIKNVTNDNQFTITNKDFNYIRNGKYQDYEIPLKYENLEKNPLLFSFFSQSKKESMIQSAIEYDLINPNSFWKLLPKNLFLEGSDYDNIDQVYINPNAKKNNNILGTSKSVNQEIVKLISIWARFFDQIKMYIDSFTELLNFSYDTIDKGKKIDGMILPLALNQAGFKFREILSFPILEKLERKNLTHEEVLSVLNVRQIQNILWKRFLLNSKDYLMSKGTKKSIKSVFNSFGLESSKYISIKEVNGQNRFNICNQYIEERQRIKFLDFNNHSYIFDNPDFNGQTNIYALNKINVLTEKLSKDDFSFENDWSLDLYFKFDKSKIKMFNLSQSIIRINRFLNAEENSVPFINVVFERIKEENESGNLKFYLNLDNTSENVISEEITNVNLMNGCLYHLFLRKRRNIKTGLYEYTINIGPSGNISYVYNKNKTIETSLQKFDDDNDSYSYNVSIGSFKYSEENLGNFNYETAFQGRTTQIRMYKSYVENKTLSLKSKDIRYTSSSIEHSNLKDLYVNIDLTQRTDKTIDQPKISLFNYVNFEEENKAPVYLNIGQTIYDNISQGSILNDYFITSEDYNVLFQNPEIDVASNSNKVYINSFEDQYYKEQYKNDNLTHSSQNNPEFLYHDDQRLYIDFSMVNFLNKDITKIISVNDYFTNLLSKTSYLYEESYSDLNAKRDDYFKRLRSNEDLNIDVLYQVYKYFDNILEDLLYDAIPSRVNYLGFNFVYESHILERNKYQYKMSECRMPVMSNNMKYQNYTDNLEMFVKNRKDDITDFFVNSRIRNKETV